MKCKLIVLIVSILLFSCGIFRKAEKTEIIETTTVVSSEDRDVFDDIMDYQYPFKTININKLTFAIGSGDQVFSVKGSLKMIRDSVILISIQPLLGFEAVRAQITPDSITVIDRIHSQYYSEPFDFLKHRAGVDFDFRMLQALLSYRIFGSEIELSRDMFNIMPYLDGYALFAADKQLPFALRFDIDANKQHFITDITDKNVLRRLTCVYSQFEKAEQFDFPRKMRFTVFEEGKMPQRLELAIGSVEFDKSVNVSFSVPAKYKKAKLEDLKL